MLIETKLHDEFLKSPPLLKLVSQAVSSSDFEELIRVQAFLDIRLRHGHVEEPLWPFLHCRPARKAACTSLTVNTKTTRGDQQQNQRSAIRRQSGALSFSISHQVQNVRVFEPLQSALAFHLPSTTILRSKSAHRTWLQNPVWYAGSQEE